MGRKSRHKHSQTQGTGQMSKPTLSVKLLFGSVIGVGIVAALAFGYGRAPSTSVSTVQVEGDNVAPLSNRGKSISGWHDMANMQKYTYRPPVPNGAPRPKISVKPANRDLGYIGSREVINLNYFVLNEGDEELVVDSLATSCGCTTAELSNNIIPPGHRADLKVRFDAGFHKVERGEKVVRAVWLRTNDPDTPVGTARLTATIR